MTVFVSSPVELSLLEGTDLGATHWVTLDQHRINRYAEATGDLRWVHIDPARAATGPFGAPIAHSEFVLALIPALFAELIQVGRDQPVLDFSYQSVEFPGVVRAGGRVRLRARVLSTQVVEGVVTAMLEAIVEQAERAPVCMATVAWRLRRPDRTQP